MLTWKPPAYTGDRHLALRGTVEIGAIFPPPATWPGKKPPPWRWRLWGVGAGPAEGGAINEAAAKEAVEARFAKFLEDAALMPKEGAPYTPYQDGRFVP